MLRNLVLKSKLDFGYYKDYTIESILRRKDGKSYMTWLYYNASHINLTEEIIKELDIKDIISKPGKNPELFESKYRARYENGYKEKIVTMLKNPMCPNSSFPYKKVFNKSYLISKNRNFV